VFNPPVGTSKCTPESKPPGGHFVEHFQQHESAGQLTRPCWQSDERPAVDTTSAGGLGSRSLIRLKAAISAQAPVKLKCQCVNQAHLHVRGDHIIYVLEREMHSVVLSRGPRHRRAINSKQAITL